MRGALDRCECTEIVISEEATIRWKLASDFTIGILRGENLDIKIAIVECIFVVKNAGVEIALLPTDSDGAQREPNAVAVLYEVSIEPGIEHHIAILTSGCVEDLDGSAVGTDIEKIIERNTGDEEIKVVVEGVVVVGEQPGTMGAAVGPARDNLIARHAKVKGQNMGLHSTDGSCQAGTGCEEDMHRAFGGRITGVTHPYISI